MGGAALTAWLRQRIAAAARETGDEERTRRLESDAEAVQVLTIHRSKGLEFPIVYCPDLWEPGYIPRDPQPVFFHDPAQDDARTIDVGLDGPDWGRHCRHHEEESRGEDLRLAYVALTRARASGGRVVGGDVGLAATRRSGGCCSRAGRTVSCRLPVAPRRATRRRSRASRSSRWRRPAASASSGRGSGCR